MARRIRRQQPWLHKYINGTGHATIDDIIAFAGYFGQTLCEFLKDESLPVPVKAKHVARDDDEIALLQTWRRISRDVQPVVFDVVRLHAKRFPRDEAAGSSSRSPEMPLETSRKAHEKPRAGAATK